MKMNALCKPLPAINLLSGAPTVTQE